MTTNALTKISYSNAYSTVLSTGAVGISHPAHGWIAIARTAASRIAPALRTWVAAHRTAVAQRMAAESASHTLRVAASLQASQPSLANELIAIGSRDR
jgi:hypothetical protein